MAVSQKLQKGINAAQKGDMKRAATMFDGVLKAEPENADALNLGGAVKHKLGRSDQAIKMIRRSLTLSPDNALAHNNLGNVLKEMGRDAEAVESYRAALKLDPLNVQCINNYGVTLRNSGQFDEAVSVLHQGLSMAPEMAELHHNLGRTYLAQGEHVKAADYFRSSLRLAGDWADPIYVAHVLVAIDRTEEAEKVLAEFLERHPDRETVRYQLDAVRGAKIERAPDVYVTKVFDNFADSFDATLAGLDYRAPEIVADALTARLGEAKADKVILDIGCGTGLCGPLIAAYKSRLVGIDLSSNMMRRAELRGCYNSLRMAELQDYLAAQKPGSYDVAVCVDTLVYLGALERTFAGVKNILCDGGLFIATVEALPDSADDPYIVDKTGRFKHRKAYLNDLASDVGLDVLSINSVVLRQEAGANVSGYVMTLQQPQHH